MSNDKLPRKRPTTQIAVHQCLVELGRAMSASEIAAIIYSRDTTVRITLKKLLEKGYVEQVSTKGPRLTKWKASGKTEPIHQKPVVESVVGNAPPTPLVTRGKLGHLSLHLNELICKWGR